MSQFRAVAFGSTVSVFAIAVFCLGGQDAGAQSHSPLVSQVDVLEKQ